MKNLLTILICLFSFSTFAFADDDKEITVSQLPQTAREFLNAYFPKEEVSYAKTDLEDGDYEVRLENGVKIDFNKLGSWTDIEGHVPLPKGIVSSNIYNHVSQNFKKAKIVKIERNNKGFEIGLNDGRELIFDLNGNFVKIDD